MFEFKNKTILILSPEDWGKNLLSKHLYAKELSKHNEVFFLHTAPHKQQNSFIKATTINNNLTVLHLKKIVKGVFKLPSVAIDAQNKLIVKKIRKHINQPIDVVWSFDQSKFQDLNQFKSKLKIFHPVDYIDKAIPFLKRIADSADYVFSVSDMILNNIKTKTPKHFVNHGLDGVFTEKHTSVTKPNFIELNKINVGYVGNLQIKLMDWNVLIKIVESNPSVNFVFIGPDKQSNIGGNKKFKQLDIIKALPNSQFVGVLEKNKLREVLHFFDCFLISYDNKKYPIHVSNSHKILEYLSTGKVIVSNTISTYKSFTLLEMVDDNINLPAKFNEVINDLDSYNSLEKTNNRINYAKDNTYAKQVKKIENIINQ